MFVGFGDESGTPHPASGERFFTVALLVVQNPRRIETLVRRTRRSLRRRARTSELKAARKHGLGEGWAAQIIAEKVIVEEKVRGTKIAALPGGR